MRAASNKLLYVFLCTIKKMPAKAMRDKIVKPEENKEKKK